MLHPVDKDETCGIKRLSTLTMKSAGILDRLLSDLIWKLIQMNGVHIPTLYHNNSYNLRAETLIYEQRVHQVGVGVPVVRQVTSFGRDIIAGIDTGFSVVKKYI